jgi:hypothetical protein
MRSEHSRQDPSHVDERRLAGAVGERLHVPLFAGLRGDANDRAARARGDHRLGDEARDLVSAEEVHAKNLLPVRPGRFERVGVDDDRRAINQAVESAELRFGGRDRRADQCRVGEVEPDGESMGASRGRDGRLKRIRANVREYDPGALSRQKLGGCASDAARRAGDENTLALVSLG